jgi:hypothetical protein
MTETIVLLMLLAWLACTLVMTLSAGHKRAERPQARRITEPPASLSGGDSQDPALASRP